MPAEEFLIRLAKILLEVIRPLEQSLESPEAFGALMVRTGWTPPADPAFLSPLKSALDLTTKIDAASGAIEEITFNQDASLDEVVSLVTATSGIIEDVVQLTSAPTKLSFAPLDSAAFWQDFARQLGNELFADYLRLVRPCLYAPLHLLGVVDRTFVPAAGPHRLDHYETSLRWDRLGDVFVDPRSLAREVYGWGDTFNPDELLERLDHTLTVYGIPSGVRKSHHPLLPHYYATPTAFAPRELRVPLLIETDPAVGFLEIGLTVLPIPADPLPSAGRPDGFLIGPYATGGVSQSIPLGGSLSLSLSGGLDTEDPVGIEVRPHAIGAKLTAAGTSFDAAAAIVCRPSTPLLLIGDAQTSRLELADFTAGLELKGAITDPALTLVARTTKMALILDFSQGDGFMTLIFGQAPQRLEAQVGIRWSSKTGVSFEGQAQLDVTLPIQKSIGPVRLDSINLGIEAAHGGDVSGVVALSGGVGLGPFAASVDKVGVEVGFAHRPGSGKFGGLDVAFGFKPPDGVGLAINSPAVSGGGFLEFDADAGRYAGVFELTLVNTVSVKAIALITTKNADGTPGFALLIIITAEGFTPIPLGFGFELTGIGGLLALNRTVNADAVRNGLRDGVVDSVLFPKDPVKNATRIISTLDRIFPLAPDRLVIGPLVEIGWGTPPIIKVRLALLLEIPKPIRAILLAALSALLPNEKAAVVELHVDAIGVLDLGRGELSLDASLHDSRILQATLSGDMALRLNWGDAPTFLLSIGGFHPRYVPPAGLRPLNRLSLSLSAGNPSVRLECYFAITSNSVQFGARLTLSAQIAGFGVDGGGAFDALIQWSPFALDVSLQAWVRITAGGSTLLAATISAEVSGPQPWHVNGTASVSVLFFSVSVHIEFTIGATAAPPPLDTVDVAQAIWTEIGQASAWQAALPPAVGSGATLAAPGGAPADAVLIHPLATVSLRQKVAPLDTPISRMGARVPKAGTQSYHVDVSAPSGVSTTSLNGLFARAQFQDVADDAKLTGASFEPLPAGVTLTPANATQAAQNGVAATDLSFETLDITSFDAPATSAGPVPALAATALTPTRDMPAARGTGATVQVPTR